MDILHFHFAPCFYSVSLAPLSLIGRRMSFFFFAFTSLWSIHLCWSLMCWSRYSTLCPRTYDKWKKLVRAHRVVDERNLPKKICFGGRSVFFFVWYHRFTFLQCDVTVDLSGIFYLCLLIWCAILLWCEWRKHYDQRLTRDRYQIKNPLYWSTYPHRATEPMPRMCLFRWSQHEEWWWRMMVRKGSLNERFFDWCASMNFLLLRVYICRYRVSFLFFLSCRQLRREHDVAQFPNGTNCVIKNTDSRRCELSSIGQEKNVRFFVFMLFRWHSR